MLERIKGILKLSVTRYGSALLLVSAAFLFRVGLVRSVGELPTYITFYPAIMLSTLIGGVGPGLAATGFVGLLAAYWILPPHGFAISSMADAVGLCLFTGMGVFITVVAELYQRARQRAAKYTMELAVRAQEIRAAAEREHLASQLAAEKNRWQATVENMLDPVTVCDAEGRAVYMNAAYRKLIGRSIAQDLQFDQHPGYYQLYRPDGAPFDAGDLPLQKAALTGAEVHDVELLQRSADGREFIGVFSAAPLRDAAGKVIGAVAVGRDVTEQRRAEEALRKERDFNAAVLDTAGALVLVLDRGARITRFNKACEELTGYSDTEVLGRELWFLIPEDQLDGVKNTWTALTAGDFPNKHENHWVAKNGARYLISWSNTALIDRLGKSEYIIAIGLDITARKQAEEQLRAAKTSAERAKAIAEQASSAKDRFLAVLSHELRTPLTPIVAAVSLLKADSTAPASTNGLLEVIQRNAEMQSRLIDDLLDLTRIARGKVQLKRQHADLCTIAKHAVEVCRPDLDARKLHFASSIGPGPYVVDADPARLQQVFWNLLKNAIKFTPNDGCVGLRCQGDHGCVVIEISDSGIGIEPAAMEHIFDAFAQAELSIARQFGGLGLGLAISKAIVEMHGGTIEAHSEGRDKGATFRVRLPLVSAGMDDASEIAASRPRIHRDLSILLVEDHADTAEMMRHILELHGHRIEVAGDVDTALRRVRLHDFDLLVSDLGLPDRSGLDLMRELRSEGRHLPGIAISGYGQESDIERSCAAGFQTHLIKPVEVDRLLAAIDDALASKR